MCRINDSYLIKLNQLANGLVLTCNTRAKYLSNDERIKSASHRLRLGAINIRIFLLQCSYSVSGYEERMRLLNINQNIDEEAPNDIGI